MAAADVVTTAAKEEDTAQLSDLQQHLQLDAFDGRYLTKQEILLLELYQSFHADAGKSASLGTLSGSSLNGSSVHDATSLSGSGGSAGGTPVSSSSGIKLSAASTLAKSSSLSASSSVPTPKRQLSSDRERVQNFLLQRQSSSGVGASPSVGGSGVTPKSGVTVSSSSGKPAMSAVERAKLVMAKKVVPSKPAGNVRPAALGGVGGGASGSSGSTTVKRTNPLTDILKGGSGSIVGGAPAVKRPRTKSDKPGEIKIQGGRSSIQLPLVSFLRTEDWDSATGPALDIVLPEVAFATNNTLIIHATMPVRSSRCCFNISTQSSMLSGAPYPGTVLYHFNPRRQRGGHIIQNSNIEGRWGCSQPLPRCPITFGEPFTLRLTIVPSGFLVFLEEIFQDEFKHRVPIREGENLVLTVPTRDENGNAEGVIVHSVWWGHAEAPPNIEQMRRGPGGFGGGGGPGGFNRGPRGYDGERPGSGGYRGGPGGRGGGGGDRFQANPHPYEVYVGNLPQGTSREELSFLFQYLGFETVRITARGFGFVTLRSAEDMHRAVEDLDGRDFNGMKLRVSCALPPK